MLDGCETHDGRRYDALPLAVTMSVEAREKGLVGSTHTIRPLMRSLRFK
jgi:hypothetical protein